MTFNPWKATLDEARSAQAVIDEGDMGPEGPVFQFAAAQRVNARRTAVDGGNGFAVLACIRDCVTHGLVAPEWLAYAFTRRYDAVLDCHVDSWDDPSSFGKPYPKGKQLLRTREDRIGRVLVWNAVVAAIQRDPTTPIDRGLFELVGKQLSQVVQDGKRLALGATRSERLYYEAIHKLGFPSAVSIAKSQKLAGIRSKRK